VQSLFQQIKAGQLWDFHGGIHPPARKQHTSQKPLGRLPLPDRLYVPLRQHIGVPGSLLVTAGQQVLKGQPLTFADNAMAVPVHAPTSGRVLAIEPHIAPHPSALPELCVVIEPDGLEQWRERLPLHLPQCDRLTLLQRIQEAGIAGMGGAGFPTHLKTGAAGGIDYLIINAVECEPYISADDMLMQEFATTIVKGIDILCELLSPAAVLIGIEDDKPAAIAAMQAACSQRDSYLVKTVPAKYPSGGEKQLIQILTSKEVPAGRRPLDIGIVMQNVGTVFAIAQAVLEDMPLISRIVTVVGESLTQPQNVLALIGTPVGFLLDACGFAPEPAQRVIMGGPMMGFTLPSISVPVVKTTNCILAPTQAELPAANQEMDCIRCGACAEVCPAVLLPQQLLWYSKAKDQDKLKEYNLADCIECGACAYVCPSEIPLVHYYRVAKAEIREQTRDELKAEQAKARFEARNERLEQEKQQRAARNQALALQRQQLMAEQQKNREIEQAQQRVAATAETASELTKEQIIALREQKKAEARAYQAEKAAQQAALETASTNRDDAARDVAAPLAASAQTAPSEHTETDPRAAAVAAAIARAKAKKAQASVEQTDAGHTAAERSNVEASAGAERAVVEGTQTTPLERTETDPRAAAVAAAIARAKAKKAQASVEQTDAGHTEAGRSNVEASAGAERAMVEGAQAAPLDRTETDPRAAAVAAAIARAKAKKAQATASAVDGSAERPDPVTSPTPGTQTAPGDQAAPGTQAAPEAQTVQGTAAVPDADLAPAIATASSDADRAAAKRQALAAAIARAKAKQQQLSGSDPKDPA